MNIDVEKLYLLEITELWTLFTQLIEEEGLNEEYKEEIDKVKGGVWLRIPIWYFTKGWYEEYPTSEKVKVTKYGKYPLQTFMEEKEERERIMRKVIYDNVDEDGTTMPRN